MIVASLLAGACGSSSPPTPSPPGSGTETITGRERFGWDQTAASATAVAALRFAVYVDNVRSEVSEVSCGTTAGPNGFACSGRLPAMSNGTHVLELVSFVDANGVLESDRSAPLRVTVTGVAPGASGRLLDGETLTTTDGLQLRVELIVEGGLRDPSALAITPDGRTFVGTADGVFMLRGADVLGPPQLTDGVTLGMALSPQFERDGHVFVTQAVPAASGRSFFRTSRLRDMGGWLADRMVILEHGPAASSPAGDVRFAPDGKLHLAFDDGGNREAAERMSEWRGKLLRMEADGRTPPDQAAASPVVWRGLASPRGVDWAADGTTVWLADASRDGVERLRVIALPGTQARRATQLASYALPAGIGASALTFYRAGRIPEFAANLFVAGKAGGYLLRIRFDDQGRPTTTERLLEGRTVTAVAVGPDGALYLVVGDALVRLTPTRSAGP